MININKPDLVLLSNIKVSLFSRHWWYFKMQCNHLFKTPAIFKNLHNFSWSWLGFFFFALKDNITSHVVMVWNHTLFGTTPERKAHRNESNELKHPNLKEWIERESDWIIYENFGIRFKNTVFSSCTFWIIQIEIEQFSLIIRDQ